MAVLSVDLAYKSYADSGAVVLRPHRGRIMADLFPITLNGAPSPDVLADFLNTHCQKEGIEILVLDGPQGWMGIDTGLADSRRCERALNTPAKTGLPGSVKPANYLGFVSFSIAVFDALTGRGWERLPSLPVPVMSGTRFLIESFPLSAWRALGLTPLPAKDKCKPKALRDCLAAITAIVPLDIPGIPNHDGLQAIVAGLAGLAVERGNWQECTAAGIAPSLHAGSWREGFIVNPTRTTAAASMRRRARKPTRKSFEGLAVDRKEALSLLIDCVNTKTANPPGDEDRLASKLAGRLEAAGIHGEVRPLAPGRANLLARLPGSGERRALILSGHTDTVVPGETPWQHDPWSARVVGDRLYGLGACDMKSGLAAMVMAMILLRRAGVRLKGDLVLAASAGEEVDGLGARAFLESDALAGAGAMVVGEPTGGDLVVAQKGELWLAITTHGEAAHSALPERGVNAILRMQQVIGRLQAVGLSAKAHPLLGFSTLSVNAIQGGTAVNVIPDRWRIDVDIRTVPADDHNALVETIRAATRNLGFTIDIEVVLSGPPMETDPSAPVVHMALDIASRLSGQPKSASSMPGITDASLYQPALGIPVIIYGPGETDVAHQSDEWVALPKYLDAIRFYAELAQVYLA